MKAHLLIVAQLALALLLMWTCFCRSVKTDRNTHREVRWAIFFEGVAAGLVFGAPVMPLLMPPSGNHWSPSWPAGSTPAVVWVVLLAAVTIVQLVTAKYWAHGQAPAQFQRSGGRTGSVVYAALLLLIGGASALPATAHAQGNWRDAGDATFMPPGSELRCFNATGCMAFTVEEFRAILQRANGTCGHIPPLPVVPMPTPKGSST